MCVKFIINWLIIILSLLYGSYHHAVLVPILNLLNGGSLRHHTWRFFSCLYLPLNRRFYVFDTALINDGWWLTLVFGFDWFRASYYRCLNSIDWTWSSWCLFLSCKSKLLYADSQVLDAGSFKSCPTSPQGASPLLQAALLFQSLCWFYCCAHRPNFCSCLFAGSQSSV